MKLTLSEIKNAMELGYEVEVIINGWSYELDKTELDQDEKVSREAFIQAYEAEVDLMFDEVERDIEDDKQLNHIYGCPVTVHWNGIYCDCEDGAAPANIIIPAIKELNDEYGEED